MCFDIERFGLPLTFFVIRNKISVIDNGMRRIFDARLVLGIFISRKLNLFAFFNCD